MSEAEDQASEVLSQSEVESILASIQAGGFEEQVAIFGGKEGKREQAAHSIQGYDFRTPVYLSPGQMRRLRIKHEDFIRTLSATVSLYLRTEFALQMSRLETIPYVQLLETLPMPSHITLFRLKPSNGICLLELSPRLGLTVLDRMMGGPGHSVKIEREFTDIEISVLQQFIGMILKEYVDSWLKYETLDYEIVEHENTARFLNIVKPEEIMLYMEMEARVGDCVAGIRLILPYFLLEGLVVKLMEEVSAEHSNSDTRLSLDNQTPRSLYNIPVPVSAHWRGLSMTLREISNLEVGDVLFVDSKIANTVKIDLGALPKFQGKLDRTAGTVKVSITARAE